MCEARRRPSYVSVSTAWYSVKRESKLSSGHQVYRTDKLRWGLLMRVRSSWVVLPVRQGLQKACRAAGIRIRRRREGLGRDCESRERLPRRAMRRFVEFSAKFVAYEMPAA